MDDLVRDLCVVKEYDELLKKISTNNAQNGRLFKNVKNYMRAENKKPRVVPKLSFEVS